MSAGPDYDVDYPNEDDEPPSIDYGPLSTEDEV